jgi:hypothetical protein
VEGSLYVAGELQSFSLAFPVHSIRLLPILKGRSWRHPEHWSYWVARCLFLFACIAIPCLFYWLVQKAKSLVRMLSACSSGEQVTLASLYNVPEPVQPVCADVEQAVDKDKQKEAEQQLEMDQSRSR